MGLMEKHHHLFTSDKWRRIVSGDNYSTNLDPLRGGKGFHMGRWKRRVPYLIYVPWLDQRERKTTRLVSGADFLPHVA